MIAVGVRVGSGGPGGGDGGLATGLGGGGAGVSVASSAELAAGAELDGVGETIVPGPFIGADAGGAVSTGGGPEGGKSVN
jgi:hypothetical protein